MITAFIGVGSNVDREKHIRAACQELSLIASNLKMSPCMLVNLLVSLVMISTTWWFV